MRIKFFEVVNRTQTVFLLLFSFALIKAYSQSAVQSISYIDEKIKAESFERGTYGYKIFSSLALNNVKGLAWTYIDFSGRVLIQSDISEGHLFAYSKLIDYKLTGDDHFRDFPIDSLLVPSAVSGTLRFTDDNKVSIEMPVEMLLSGGVIDLSELNISLDSLSKLNARIRVEKFIYSKTQWEVFERQTRLINLYYAYTEILNRLVKNYTTNGINRDQSSANVFMAWHEIQRVNGYVRSHEFVKKLGLNDKDPNDFVNLFDQAERLEKRANTLYDQVLALQSKSSLSAKNKFTSKFSELSENYNSLSEKEQPYIASGFEEVVRIFPNQNEFERLKQVADFYDVFNEIDTINTLQTIYNNYLFASLQANKSEKYVLSLDLLYNAALFSSNFTEVKKSSQQNQIYARTLDGLLDSYLHVAIMAYNTGSFDMADKYYEKAMDIYKLHQSNLEGEALSEDSFLNFIEQQVELAYGYLTDEKFREGLRLVDKASMISVNHRLNYSESQLDSAYRIGYLGIYKEKIDSLGNLIENTKIEQALAALEQAANYSLEKENYINGDGDEELKIHAQSLFDIYFKRGKRLFDFGQSEEALFAFLDAQTINTTYLGKQYPELDSLIYNATVPVILNIIKKAEFETWANRMDNALMLQQQATEMQEKYKQTNNDELNAAFLVLQQKIDNRSCVNLANKLFELLKKTENRLKSKKYKEAETFLNDAYQRLEENSGCDVNTKELDKLKQTYQPVFNFLNRMEVVEMRLDENDFTDLIRLYLAAENFYKENNIEEYGVEMISLRDFTGKQNQQALTIACAEFYMQKENFEEAFFYLTLLKKSGVPPKTTKSLQTILGTQLSADGQYLSPVEKYTGGDRWYRYFRKAYLRN